MIDQALAAGERYRKAYTETYGTFPDEYMVETYIAGFREAQFGVTEGTMANTVFPKVQLMGEVLHSPFCVCNECVRNLAAESEAEDVYNRDLRITKAIERAAVTIAAAILAGADGNASDKNQLPCYPEYARILWDESNARP